MYLYKNKERACAVCGEVKVSDAAIKSTMWIKCSSNMLGKYTQEFRDYPSATSYIYFCRHCSSVRIISNKRKSSSLQIFCLYAGFIDLFFEPISLPFS